MVIGKNRGPNIPERRRCRRRDTQTQSYSSPGHVPVRPGRRGELDAFDLTTPPRAMQILLRNISSGHFLDTNGQWTKDPQEAKNFRKTCHAIEAAANLDP